MSAVKGNPNANNLNRHLHSSGDTFFLLACVLFAFVIRFFFIPQESVINGDGAYYTILGEWIASGDFGGGISAYWSPLYSFLTGLSSLLFTEREWAGRFISLIAGSVLIIPAYFLIRDFFGRTAAYVGSILLVLHPFLIKSSGWVMTESVYTLIITTCVLIGWSALSTKDWRYFLLTGLLIGIAFLTKPEAIGYLGLLLGLALAGSLFGKRTGFLKTAKSCLILLAAFGLFFVPYYLYLHQKTGKWTLSQKIAVNLPAADYEGEFLALTRDGRMTMKDRIWGDDYETQSSSENASHDPSVDTFDFPRLKAAAYILGSKALLQLRKQLRDYIPAILPVPFAVFAIASFLFGPWSATRTAKEGYLFLFVICTLLGYAASSVELRYLFPIIPALIAWTASGIVKSSERLAKLAKSVLEPRPVVFALFILILLSGWAVPRFNAVLKQDDITNVPFEEKDAGLWIKEHSPQERPIVMSSHITPAFYAHGKHIYLPDEDVSTVLNYARFRRTDYLVFSTRRKSDVLFLSNNASILQDMPLVYHDQQRPGYEVLVYQLNN